MLSLLLAWVSLAMSLTFVPLAQAGTACAEKKTDPHAFLNATSLAERTILALDESGAQVALIGRVGQDLSRYGLRYSHVAYVWRDHPKGRWTVVHELNQCGTASSGLYDEGLLNFFLDDLFAYEAVILTPSKDLQTRIVRALAGTAPQRMHSASYNMLAYAFSTRYQNSNQWVLETFAAAMSDLPVHDREAAQAWLRLAGYRPGLVYVPAPTRLGARMFKANVSFDDHPFGRRMAGQIDTVTVESVLRFVQQRDAAAKMRLVAAE